MGEIDKDVVEGTDPGLVGLHMKDLFWAKPRKTGPPQPEDVET